VNMNTGYYILKYLWYRNVKLTHCLRVPGVGSVSTYSSWTLLNFGGYLSFPCSSNISNSGVCRPIRERNSCTWRNAEDCLWLLAINLLGLQFSGKSSWKLQKKIKVLWIELKYTPSILVCNVQVVLLWFRRADHKILIFITTYMFNSTTLCVWTFWQISHIDECTGKVVPVTYHTYILQIGNILKIGTAELSASCLGHSMLMVSCTSTYSLGVGREDENLLPQPEIDP